MPIQPLHLNNFFRCNSGCAHDLLFGGGLLAGHNALVRVLDALLPNLVDVAGESLGLHCAAAVFSNQLVHVVQLLLIVVGNGNGLLVGIQNNTHDLPPIKENV